MVLARDNLTLCLYHSSNADHPHPPTQLLFIQNRKGAEKKVKMLIQFPWLIHMGGIDGWSLSSAARLTIEVSCPT